jgi:hypothetical protein
MVLGPRGRRWWPELAIVVACYLAYRHVRGAAPSRVEMAHRNAELVVASTPAVLRHLELLANQLADAHVSIAAASAVFYLTLHLPVTAAVLVWLWRAHPDDYGPARTALVVVSLVGLLFFWAFPVAPPRLFVPGAADTVLEVQQSVGLAGSGQPDGFVNDYAAFPSLHIAWACWCAWCVFSVSSSRLRRVVWLYPAVTAVVLVATANHYVWDLAAGAVCLAAVLAAVGGVERWRGARSGAVATEGLR